MTANPPGSRFRQFIEERFPFGEFALLRGRGTRGEVGFVLADDRIEHWPRLIAQAQSLSDQLNQQILNEHVQDRATATVGRDLDFITVSIVVDLTGFDQAEIEETATLLMGFLHEVNPYSLDE